MKNIKSYITVAALALSATASAQNLTTGYFNDGYLYRHELNPAAGNEMNYVSMPVLGNFNFGMNSNIGVDNLFFKVKNGKTATFLHPEVSAAKFAKGINDNNKVSEALKLQIMGAGFKAFNGYNTIEINAVENLGVNIPGSLLKLAKNGLENKNYQIKDLNVHADAYMEIGLGHSHDLSNVVEGLRVGGKVKFLLGIANLDANINNINLNLNESQYTAHIDGEIQANMSGANLDKADCDIESHGNHQYVNGINTGDSYGLGGFGLAFDLGAEYQLDENWKFALAVTDLGFISWSNNLKAVANDYTFDSGSEDYKINIDDNDSFNDVFEKMGDDFTRLTEFQDGGNAGSRTRAIGANLNFGAEYTPNFYDKMSFGLMNNTRIAGKYTWTDFRLSANVAPTDWVSASASFGAGTYGASFGWLLDIHPKGFNLYLAMDRTFGKFVKPGVPKTLNGSVSMGINFPF